jgi:predicted regulator of Ras-like GTPase activity (Roadblock/LC7/MglB family)
VADVLQFLHIGARTGALQATAPNQPAGTVWIRDGELYDAAFGDVVGIEALAQMIPWRDGEFWFDNDGRSPRITLDAPLASCLMQAAQRLDELDRAGDGGRHQDAAGRRVLEEFLESTEATLVLLLDSETTGDLVVGDQEGLEVDALSAAFREMLSGAGFVASVLGCETEGELTLQLDRHEVWMACSGPFRLAVIAPATARLGVIRHRSKRLVQDLQDILDGEAP